ncbi:D-alanine--poly(phosphoribitol) ligase subunit 1 [Agrilactobacillus composti DSM 18527 = JCM 14202]|uniref:D-alanine--D-alanyl carrier protein ligase n=1 Tax=Agrilactobacillus composti DSM 18527 = JCM 14202 TaxID=1423734 RepID=X0QMM2_9LACO|nr:D-alanine--poly(phosphoribitol) ligase subunit DltA [Agrilactobacillus composti]KRM32452.1 D-alanine--poly(phosphoribitol) ligase subunit 1 [Agrilactobacillus composti DSM 18527 = JCM 14202]GAF39875.1 D-alanine-poly(phosphoribitol) ligase subunit 1 [Agrilactobacillus composti DSM 18527 = JCM 14202]
MAIANIITTIDQNAQSFPQRICYEDQGQTYSYQALKATSDRVAAFLQAQDLPKGSPVVIYGGQTFAVIATFLGAVKAGHAYIPVDTHSPKERLIQINDVAHPGAVLEVESLPVTLKNTEVISAATLKAVRDDTTGPTAYDTSVSVTEDDNFYIIFTSGTTGVPKGVQISHANLLSYVNWTLSDFDLYPGIRALSQAPYSFDLSVMDLYPTLALGGTLVALPKEITDNFKDLFAALPNLKVNEWVSTPSFVEICLLEPSFAQAKYPDLTRFLFCGEELTQKTARELLKRFPDAEIYNTYGPTEATVAVTAVQITQETVEQYSRLPIGQAKPDTLIYAVDEHDQKVENNVNGELIIAGPSVSKGYLNNPEKTAKAFFTLDGQQAYRSGDLGFIDDQGMIFYRGRTDFQIKMHGYRIELEDVDQNLLQVSYVKQASTVPRYNDLHKVTQLVAYVVPNKNEFESDIKLTQAIKAELSQNVMEYMVPQRIIFKDNLPLTANGKVDRKTLIAEVNNS